VGAAFFSHGRLQDLSMTGCPFSVIGKGKLLQYELIHVHSTAKSTSVLVSPVYVNKFFLFYRRFILKIMKK
jgi:hypothetical protein